MFRFATSLLLLTAIATLSSAAEVRRYTDSAKKLMKANPKIKFGVLLNTDSGIADAELANKLNKWGAGQEVGNTRVTIEKGAIVLRVFFVHEGVESQPAAWRLDKASEHLYERAKRMMAKWNEDLEFDQKRFLGVELRTVEDERTETKGGGKRKWKYVATAVGVILTK